MSLTIENAERLAKEFLAHAIDEDVQGLLGDQLVLLELDQMGHAGLIWVEHCLLRAAISELSEILHLEPPVVIELMASRAAQDYGL
jgi:hypothetical protein